MSFLSKGEEVLSRVVAECEGLGKSESSPKMEGRYMRIMLTPVSPAKPKKGRDVPVAEPKKEVAEPKKEKDASGQNRPDLKTAQADAGED
jgi:translation initiation factor IF-3